MVITGVENWSPDMIPMAFERKFDEKKMRYLPGFVDLIYFIFFNIGNLGADIKPKNCHKWGPRGSPHARIRYAPYFHIHKGFLSPKVFHFIQIHGF